MLRNVITKSSLTANARSFANLQSSLLVRTVTPAVIAAVDAHLLSPLSSSSRSSQQFPPNCSNVRLYSSWGRSRPRSNSINSSNNNKHGGVQHSSTPRPMVNGKPVAFHIKDLAAAAPITHDSATNHKKREYDSNLIVILDMDEMLIHSQFLSPAAQQYAHQLLHQQRRNQQQQLYHQQQERAKSTSTAAAANGNNNNAIVDSFRFHLPDGDLVHVHMRPGLSDFLRRVTDRFETHIFTAAMPIYANPILDKLDPDGTMFAGRWFRDTCTYHDNSGAFVKNLDRLPFDKNRLDRVVLVDNNPLSFLANPSNGILVNSFYTDPTDKTLPAVWDLLVELDEQHDDVRPVLQERFALHKTLTKVRNATATANNDERCWDQATVAAV